MSVMSSKHFVKLANAIAEVKDREDRVQLAHNIGSVCAKTNPSFDWGRWNAACNV